MGERVPTGTPGPDQPPSETQAEPRPRPPQSNYVPDEREATVKVQALDEQQLLKPDPSVALSFHRRVAAQLLKDRAYERAFSELMLGLQDLTIDGVYATELVSAARRAGMEVAAAAGLEGALQRAAPEHRSQIRRRLARLYRKLGRHPQARDHLQKALNDEPRDVRSRGLRAACQARGER